MPPPLPRRLRRTSSRHRSGRPRTPFSEARSAGAARSRPTGSRTVQTGPPSCVPVARKRTRARTATSLPVTAASESAIARIGCSAARQGATGAAAPERGSGRRPTGPPQRAPSTDRRRARCPPYRHVLIQGPVSARHPHNASPRARPPTGARWCGIPRRSAARPGGLARHALPQRSQAAPKMNGVSDQHAPHNEKSSSTRAPQFRHSGGNTACSSVCNLMFGP
jgi:hypothetical protein